MKVKYKNNSLLEHYILFEGVSLSSIKSKYVVKGSSAFSYIKTDMGIDPKSDLSFGKVGSEINIGRRIEIPTSLGDDRTFDFTRVKDSALSIGISSDHLFIMIDKEAKVIKAICSFTTASILNNTRMFDYVKINASSNDEKEFYSKILLKFISDLKTSQANIGFIESKIDYEFAQVLLDTGKFQRTKDHKYIVNGISSPEEKPSTTAPDTEKNNPVGGTRDWENKSSGLKRNRKDGMPGGNTGKDYTTKGDHGQAGLDMLATALNKTGDYVLDKEASKKYRV